MSKVMKCIRIHKFGGVDQLKVDKDGPVPAYGDDQVLVRMYASGINPVDTYIREGAYPCLPTLPYVVHKDGAGVIEAIGSKVEKFKVGDRVFINSGPDAGSGTAAEFANVSHNYVFPLSDKLSFSEGACLGVPYLTAWRALFFQGGAKAGKRVLVHGASGGVGLATVQIAKNQGMVVVGSAGTEEGLKLVRQMGADQAVNHRQKNYIEELQKGEQFDVIIEMLSNVNLQHDLTLMKPRGTTVIVGSRGEVTIDPRGLMGGEKCIKGCALFASTPEEYAAGAEGVLKGIQDGWVKPQIEKQYSMEEVSEAHEYQMKSSGAKGKLIVKIRD